MDVGIGFSCTSSSEEAGAEAASQALRSVEEPILTFLFTTEDYNPEAVLEGVLPRIGASCLVGVCSAGIITPYGIYRRGVAALTFGGKGMSAATALVKFDGSSAEESGKQLGKSLLEKAPAREGTVFVFPDGLVPNIGKMLCDLYGVLGPDFRYAGGGAGYNLRFVKTYQMTEQGVASTAVAAALVSGCSFGIGVGHGWRSMGSPLIITKARGCVVYEFEEQPAFEVYSRRLGGVSLEDFAEIGARHPLGIVDASGRHIVRDPLKVLPGGAIQLASDIPSKAVAYLMTAEADDLLGVTRDVAAAALRSVRMPRFALVFNCVSRSLLLGGGSDEISIIREVLGTLPFVGFLSFGEVAPYDDVALFHNKSLVIAVGGE